MYKPEAQASALRLAAHSLALRACNRKLFRDCSLGFTLAEDFYWHNPSKLPSPIEWVNKRKMRVKDSVNTVWWFSRTPWPKADVTKVLTEYSDRMKTLLKNPAAFYDPAKRPSGHDISDRFGKDNGGAIPPNLLQIPNSESNSRYTAACEAAFGMNAVFLG